MSELGSDSAGDGAPAEVPQGSWMVRFRPWLTLVARLQVESRFCGKFDASDIVQQTLMEAWRAEPQFRGTTEAERVAWLRRILARVLAHEVRRYRGTLKRDLHRERSMERSLDESSRQLNALFVSALTSPSENVARREQEVLLAEILEKLPADYREVIILRNLEGLSHDEVAERMGRTPGAIRMLWLRALQELRRHFAVGDSGCSCNE